MKPKNDLVAVSVLGTGSAEAASRDGVMAALTSEQLAAIPLGPLTLGAWVSAIIMLGTACYAAHRVHAFYYAVVEKRRHHSAQE